MTHSDEDCEWRDRQDSNPKTIGIQVFDKWRLREFTKEQWILIWIEISDKDLQVLSRFVQKWRNLNDELKRAVFEGGGVNCPHQIILGTITIQFM